MVTVSVPGKVILMGDHAVVYGKPGLIAAINRRLTVSIEPASELQVVSDEGDDYVRHAVTLVSQKYSVEIPKVKIVIVSDIPPGYHLGSSAAAAVGTVAATMYFLKKIWNPTAINQLAYEVEKYIHKTPSGIDNTAVTFGGFLWYRKELEFLRSFWQPPMKLPASLNHFSLIDTGRPKENTGELVAYVRKNYGLHPARYQKLFDRNEVETKRIATAVKEGDEETLADAMQKGERTLEGMGVVSTTVISLIRSIEKSGGAAKILGGGGRAAGAGYILCYSHNPPTGSLPIILGEEGVRLERT